MKKKTLLLLAALVTTASVWMVGCGTTPDGSNDANNTTNQTQDETNGDTTSAVGYVFESNGVSIAVDADMDALKEQLGEPKSVFEEPSCAAQGTAYLYSYSGFEINTYPDGDKNLIAYILLKDDTVATSEGVDLSMTKEDVIEAYGDDYEGDDNKMTYSKDGMKLNFLFDGENMISIEYDSGALN